MKREEAKEILRIKLSALRRAEIMLEMNENDVREMKEDIKELEAIINKKIEEEKPLFVTEDGVEIYINNVELFAVNSTFITASDNNFDFEVCKKEGWKLFFHKSNADEYIWRNKRVFSYKDIQNYGVHPVNMIRVEQLAKERVEQ